MGLWFERETVSLPGTFKGSEIIVAIEVVTTEAKCSYHFQQRSDGTYDVGQRSGYSWEDFCVGGPTASIYDDPFIDSNADYDTLVIDNVPWDEGGFEGGMPAGDEMRTFVDALLEQLRKQAGGEGE